jgi:NADH dehydrogenase FAD-containing subunit
MTEPLNPAAPQPAANPPTPGARQWVLLGAGPAHVQLLQALAAHPVPGVQITLVAAHASQWLPGRVADFVAGSYSADDCQWPLEPLVQRCGVQWLRASVRALHASARTLELDDGRTLPFDWMSINIPGVHNRDLAEQGMPGAREHGLFAHPQATFCALWPQVLAMAEQRPLRFTVVGAGATGIALACALQHRLPAASITLLSGEHPPGQGYPPALQQRVVQALKQRKITVLQDRALGMTATCVQLGCGAELASDVTVLATPKQVPRWLLDSGLELGRDGLMAVDDFQRSTSHPWVFACGDVCSTPARADSGVCLTNNLTATVAGQALTAPATPPVRWQVISLGPRNAAASWRGLTAQGAWVWWLKAWQDHRWLKSLRSSTPSDSARLTAPQD